MAKSPREIKFKDESNTYKSAKGKLISICSLSPHFWLSARYLYLNILLPLKTLHIYSQTHYFLCLLCVPITVNIIIIFLAHQAIR